MTGNIPGEAAARPAQIVLASASPRRRELLDQIGVCYRLCPVDIAEVRGSSESPQDYVLRVALDKARAGWAREGGRLPALGADTEVVLDGEVLGKPRDRAHALAMLERLSGRSHQVLSAVALVGERELSRLCVSTVSLRATTAQERAAYWASGEPQDKAGGYAIQGRAAAFITRIEGSYSAVMGLALYETAELLRAFGIDIVEGWRAQRHS